VSRTSLSYEDVLAWVQAYASTIAENREQLTKLDSAIGDADHGINMDRGMKAALAKLDGLEGDDVGSLLKTIGMTLVSTIGGAGGPLYGTLFLQMGTATAGKTELEPADWRAALEAGLSGVQMRGKAEPGDKTMVDALMPGKDALAQALSEGAEFA
jgi:phosphoenolpyruvate---glycerone phosphotransferase subunit DhaL